MGLKTSQLPILELRNFQNMLCAQSIFHRRNNAKDMHALVIHIKNITINLNQLNVST
jgi:hypothetical protein